MSAWHAIDKTDIEFVFRVNFLRFMMRLVQLPVSGWSSGQCLVQDYDDYEGGLTLDSGPVTPPCHEWPQQVRHMCYPAAFYCTLTGFLFVRLNEKKFG